MNGKKAAQELVRRMYRQHEQSTGRLPDGKAVREMEKKAVRVAERVEKKRPSS